MDAALLSRIQFGFTVGFHYLFVPLSIGLAWFVMIMLWKHMMTGEAVWRNQAGFWLKRIFAGTFAIGVATGIVLEFQFGTNWSEYSRIVGDIFGAPLAAEGILAFFLESAFFGALLMGWNRFSPRLLWFCSLMVALGSTLSAFWIIVANSWMQTPAGYHMVGGRAELYDFWAALFNPSTMPRYVHTVLGALMVGAFFVLGLSAYFLLKNRDHDGGFRRSLNVAIVVALLASLAQLSSGHWHAVQVAHTQPEKLAAMEGLFDTQTNAPALLFGFPSAEDERVHFAIEAPGLLSLMVHGSTEGEVKGLKSFPRDEWPPLHLTFYSFHLMVALGGLFIGLSLWGAYLMWRKRAHTSGLFLKLAILALPLPFVANEVGWIAAEVGRQPWIVYRLLRTADAISISVPAEQILASLVLFFLIYSLLFGLWIFLLRKAIREGATGANTVEVAA